MISRDLSFYSESLINSNASTRGPQACDWIEVMSTRAERAVAWRRRQRDKRRLQQPGLHPEQH